jgi:hypothetical protein
MGQKKKYEKICFSMKKICVVGFGTRALSRRVPCPPLKVVLEAKNQPKKEYENIFVFMRFLF